MLADLFLPACDPAIDELHALTALYTHDPVVDELLTLARWPERGGTLLDPAAGDGVFAERAILRLPLRPNEPGTLAARVEAWEIHPQAVDAARIRIARQLLRRGWSSQAAHTGAERVVHQTDFLTHAGRDRSYAVISTNPPFLRQAFIPSGYLPTFRDATPEYARADLLHAYLARSAHLLAPGGCIAFVTSDRWLGNLTASRLRERLGEHLGIDSLRPLDASSSFYRPKRRRRGTPPRIHPVAVVLSAAGRHARRLGPEPVSLGPPQASPPGAVLLGEVAQLRIAPWLGPRGVFTLDAADAAHLPASSLVPCVGTEDIDGDRLRKPHRVAIRTDRRAEPPAAVAEHLRRTLHQLPPRARRSPFWAPPEAWGPLPLAHDAILVPRIARGLRPILLPAGVLPLDHAVTVCAAADVPLATLMAALRSDHAQAWIHAHAPKLENGFRSITTGLLRRLPVQLHGTP